MTLPSLLASLADRCQRKRLLVVLAGLALILLSVATASRLLGVSTDTDAMFSENLPWRQRQIAFDTEFPQSRNLLVAVIDASVPEEADATAESLRAALSKDPHFLSVRRPDASPYLAREGLLFLDSTQLQQVLDNTLSAQPFLGQLVADPSARGLFASLGLIGLGVTHAGVDISGYTDELTAFHNAMRSALDGKPRPLSWQTLLGGDLADLAGPYRFVLAQPKLDFGALQPGGEATAALRDAASKLEFVKAGLAHVRVTGSVALADEEFATVAHGAVAGLLISLALITLWLFLAVRSWRLILPILFTLFTGLSLTLLFASVFVGTLNLVSVGFGILFVGIAVDFAIQFGVRFRDAHHSEADIGLALTATARRAGSQILVAACATASGFLAFVPTDFAGVAELGLIAGFGMLFAFICTMTFLPAAIALCRPRRETAEIGFQRLAPVDAWLARHASIILPCFCALALTGAALTGRLVFDSDPLHTKDPHTEAMETLRDLMANPVTSPYTADVLVPSAADAATLAARLEKLSRVASVLTINSLVPADQPAKLAAIEDARQLLAPTLAPRAPMAKVTPADIRLAAKAAEAQITPALAKLPKDSPLVAVAEDLRQAAAAPDATLMLLDQAMTRFLPGQLAQLRSVLSAEPASIASIPADVKADWLLPDGRARVQVVPRLSSQDSAGLRLFDAEVTAVVPDAGGPAIAIVATADTIIGAFRTAAIGAIIAIAVILFISLRRLLDTAMVLSALLLSALLTVVGVILLGLELNFANIIALPLLLGVGVSFNIYFVMNWRGGATAVLSAPTARAVMFSALTTGSAFGSLALSRHPGTASMGILLLISLGATLISSFLYVPALLAALGPRPVAALAPQA